MTPRRVRAAALVLAAVLAAPAPAPAAAPTMLAQARGAIGADEAAAVVAGATGGRVLGVRSERHGERHVFRVKVLLGGGRVRTYLVDARTGRILDGGS